jgi:hypothetical protein
VGEKKIINKSSYAKNCPDCGKLINLRRLPLPRYSSMALGLFVLAAIGTIVWVIVLFHFYSAMILEKSMYNLMFWGIVAAAPGLGVGCWAVRLAKVRTFFCKSCSWKTSIKQ